MNTRLLSFVLLGSLLIASSVKSFAQEAEVVETTEVSESPFSVGADVVSSYVWRGTKFSGPAIQPGIEYGIAGLSVGAWGSYGFDGFSEADLYAAYAFDFGLSLGVTDYFYPGTDYSEFGDTVSNHAIEANLGYEISNFYVSANYIFNNSAGGAGSKGGDMYFEAGYGFKHFDVFVGAGDGWHTVAGSGTNESQWDDDAFGLCNVGIGTSKDIQITDKYSLPVFGQAVWNPEANDFNIVVGVTF